MTGRGARGVPWGVLSLLALFGVVVAIGFATPPARHQVGGADSLGLEAGESAQQYRARAADSLAQVGGEPRWALVSFAQPATPRGAAEAVAGAGARVSQVVVVYAAGEDQWTDWVDIPAPPPGVGAVEDAVATALRVSASRLGEGSDRRDQAARDGLLRGCACVRNLVVRGDGPTLRQVAAAAGVVAVQALPADAVYGSFSVRPG